MNDIVLISVTKEDLQQLFRSALQEELAIKKEKEILSFREVCELLGISPSALNKWKSENKIPFKKMGKRIFFNRLEVLNALKDSGLYTKTKYLKAFPPDII